MKKLMLCFVIAVVAVAGIAGWEAEDADGVRRGAQRSSAVAVARHDDPQELVRIFDTYAASVNAGDLQTWIELWDENGMSLPPDAVAKAGKANLYAENVEAFKLLKFDMKICCEEAAIAGDFGFVRGQFSYSVRPKDGSGSPFDMKGKFLTVFRKQADGTWRIYRDMYNRDAPAT